MAGFLGLLRTPTGDKPPRHKQHHPHKSLPLAHHRLSFNQVRSIYVNGSIDYGRFMAKRFDQGCGIHR